MIIHAFLAKGLFKNDVIAQGGGGVSEIMINSLILILNKEEKPMTRGGGGSILGKISMSSFLNSP